MGCGNSKCTAETKASIAPASNGNTANQQASGSYELSPPRTSVEITKYRDTPSAAHHEECNEEVKDLPTGYLDDFMLFAEFPTNHLLREANQKHASLGKPIPRGEAGELLPYPAIKAKSLVFNLENYQKIDEKALQISTSVYSHSLKDVTELLVEGLARDDELSRARVIFRWLAGQDLESLPKLDKEQTDSTLAQLTGLKDGTKDYAHVYLEMCKIAGVQGERVRGQVKANIGKQEEEKSDSVNYWTAIVIANQWHLIDPYWGSCHVVGGSQGEWELIDDNGTGRRDVSSGPKSTKYSCDEFYFLTNPEEMIYTHLPDSEDWQLLARPVSKSEFRELAYLREPFFLLGLQLMEHRHFMVQCTDGEMDLRIGTPFGQQRSFMYRLWMSSKGQEKETMFGNYKFERFCFMQQRNCTLIVRIFFPVAGKFKLELFGRDDDDPKAGPTFKCACVYVINCDRAADDCHAFPENSRHEWGPGRDLEAAGLRARSHKDGLIEADDGTVQLHFQATKPVEILHDIYSNDRSKEEMEHYAVHQWKNEEVTVNVRLPHAGDFAFNLYAKDEGEEGPFSNVCSYLLSTNNPIPDGQSFPKVPNGHLGQTKVNGIEIILVSHDSPFIPCPDEGELHLKFSLNKSCDTLVKMELQRTDELYEKKNYTWSEYKENFLLCHARFPEPGTYVLKLYAKEWDQEGTYSLAYTCVIDVTIPSHTTSPFPQAYSKWGPGCKLLNPLTAVLLPNETVKFSAVIPEAYHVMVWTNNGTPQLVKQEGIWEGEVSTGDGGGEMELAAEMVENSNSYSTLLVFQVKSPERKADFMEKDLQEQHRLKEEAENKKLFELEVRKKREQQFKEIKEEAEKKKLCELEARKTQEQQFKEIKEEAEKKKLLELEAHKKREQQFKEIKEEAEKKKLLELEARKIREQQFKEIKEALLLALEKRDLAALKVATKNVRRHKYTGRLEKELEDAHKLIKSLERINHLRKAVLNMDQATMSEIRRYNQPPKVVHEVMKASLLLLGDHEGSTEDWKDCQKLCVVISASGLNRRVKDFQIVDLHPEIAARAAQILAKHRKDIVTDISAGAGIFFTWAQGLIEERMLMMQGSGQPVPVPANLSRQKELLAPQQTKRG